MWNTHYALQVTDEDTFKYLTGFIRVTDVFEGFCGIDASYIKENFFTTAVNDAKLAFVRAAPQKIRLAQFIVRTRQVHHDKKA
jgi:hypothetical protein